MNKQWHVYSSNEQKGPYSWDQLKKQTTDGRLKKDDLVWTEGMDDWDAASNTADLFPVEVTPPPIPQQYQAKPPIPPALRKESFPAANHSQSVSPDSADARQEQAPKGKSPLKILALVGGGIVVLTALVMAVILLVAPDPVTAEMEIYDLATSAGISDDHLPLSPTDSFSHMTDTIYATMKIDNIPEGMVFYSQWIYKGEVITPEKDTFTTEYTDANYAASLPPLENEYFEPGDYLFELRSFEDDQLLADIRFEVFWENIPIEEHYPDAKIFRAEGYAFAYPQDWSHVLDDGIDFINKDGFEGDVSFYIISHDALASESDYDNSLLIAGYNIENIESFDGTVVDIFEETMIIDGIEYPYVEIAAEIPMNGKIYFTNSIIIKPEGSNVYSFAYIAHEDHYDTYQNDVATMVNSITFQ